MTTEAPNPVLHLVVPCHPSKLSAVRKFVEEATGKLAPDLAQDKVFALKVAVSEACANAIEHSICTQPTANHEECIQIQATMVGNQLRFCVEDRGIFRPPVPLCTDGQNRGLGLPLMITLMDEVRFERTASGGTKVILIVYTSSQEPQQQSSAAPQTHRCAQRTPRQQLRL